MPALWGTAIRRPSALEGLALSPACAPELPPHTLERAAGSPGGARGLGGEGCPGPSLRAARTSACRFAHTGPSLQPTWVWRLRRDPSFDAATQQWRRCLLYALGKCALGLRALLLATLPLTLAAPRLRGQWNSRTAPGDAVLERDLDLRVGRALSHAHGTCTFSQHLPPRRSCPVRSGHSGPTTAAPAPGQARAQSTDTPPFDCDGRPAGMPLHLFRGGLRSAGLAVQDEPSQPAQSHAPLPFCS
jgi:hypothetical protein